MTLENGLGYSDFENNKIFSAVSTEIEACVLIFVFSHAFSIAGS